jgi:hypothetical protein
MTLNNILSNELVYTRGYLARAIWPEPNVFEKATDEKNSAQLTRAQ